MGSQSLCTVKLNLLDIIGRDTELKRKASTKGGEYSGPCPFCGGKDRFMVWPEADRPGWYCRQCKKSGDTIGYVMQKEDVDFREACRVLEVDLPQRHRGQQRKAQERKPLTRKTEKRSEQWQAFGWKFVDRCQEVLASQIGAPYRRYLETARGLTPETLKLFKIGYCPKDDPSHRFYRGITIPWFAGDQLFAVNIRRDSNDGGEKYRNLKGGQWSVFGLPGYTGKRTIWITEGEFDAMLLRQIIGDHVDVLTCGGSGNKVPDTYEILFDVDRLWIATDNDEAGEKAAEYWMKFSGKARRALPPQGKDITDAHLAGADLRAWAIETMGLQSMDNTAMDAEPDYITMAFPPDSKVPVIAGKWERNEANEIVATYTRSELEMCMEMMR